jgi:hypothetical protein
MIRLARPYLELLEALERLGSANKATDVLIHRACVLFAEMVAGMTKQRCVVIVGSAVIARGSHAKT